MCGLCWAVDWLFSWPEASELEDEEGVEFTPESVVAFRARLRGDFGDMRSRVAGLEGLPVTLEVFAERRDSRTLGRKGVARVGGELNGVVEVMEGGSPAGVWLWICCSKMLSRLLLLGGVGVGVYRRQGDCCCTGVWEPLWELSELGEFVRAMLNFEGDREMDRRRLLTDDANTST